MKKITFFILAILLCAGCSTLTPVTSPEDSTLVRIECRNDPSLLRQIMMKLRSSKARDIKIDDTGALLYISAAFIKENVSRYKIADMCLDLQEMPGVFRVETENNRKAVLQPF